ncbi:hypothetical protein N7537_010655 [Penicillium hordei]|uniref:Uncharacterized protein n=1 Tax=Penicillium hordei TaxID=40994 RepID=A0AAD6DVD6_9EURO|nr:uncharacterized protein N7537_010655 [Penicillium hordei]KAJ5593751.1 hypothetical protein N7537_010655 [Penicillium hordei]
MGTFKGPVLRLFQSADINVASRDVNMETPLVLAFERRNFPAVQAFLDFKSVSNKTNPLIIDLLPQAVQVLNAQDSQFALKILHSAVVNDDEALVGIFCIQSSQYHFSDNGVEYHSRSSNPRTPYLDDKTTLMYDPCHVVAEASDEYLTKIFLYSGKINAKSRDGCG